MNFYLECVCAYVANKADSTLQPDPSKAVERPDMAENLFSKEKSLLH